MTGKELKEHIKHIVNANHWDPFQVLGMHIIDGENKRTVVRAFLPEAQEAWVVDMEKKKSYPMEKIHDAFLQTIIAKKASSLFSQD
jgi:1,4-alpha-glucan branching enzyme